jgi:hypothetical protein
VAEWVTCIPVRPAFRKALALAAAARGLAAALGDGAAVAGDVPITPLARVAAELDVAARILAGRSDASPLARDSALGPTPAQLRARAALVHVGRIPRQVRGAVRALGARRLRATMGEETARALRRRGRVLLRGTKSLKRDLKRLQQVSQTFAR